MILRFKVFKLIHSLIVIDMSFIEDLWSTIEVCQSLPVFCWTFPGDAASAAAAAAAVAAIAVAWLGESSMM